MAQRMKKKHNGFIHNPNRLNNLRQFVLEEIISKYTNDFININTEFLHLSIEEEISFLDHVINELLNENEIHYEPIRSSNQFNDSVNGRFGSNESSFFSFDHHDYTIVGSTEFSLNESNNIVYNQSSNNSLNAGLNNEEQISEEILFVFGEKDKNEK